VTEESHSKAVKSATEAIRVVLLSTVLAFAGLEFLPLLKSGLARAQSSAGELNRLTYFWGYPAVIAFCILALLCLAFVMRLWRSLRQGLLSFRAGIWVIALTLFLIFLDLGHLRSAVASIVIAGGLIYVRKAISLKAQVSIDEATYLMDPDLPVSEDGKDLLDRGGTISQLASIVVRERPSVVALTGGYGDGKTSVLNLTIGVLRKREREQRPIIVKFSPWLPGDSNSLILSLLTSILAEIRKEYLIPGLSGGVMQYAKTLLAVLPKADTFKGLLKEKSQEERIRSLTDSIAKMPRRILVALDNLDRMEAQELETVFKILRGSDELATVTFVCCFDSDELALILRSTREFQETSVFVEKFFQTKVSLPAIDSAKLKDLFREEMSRLRARELGSTS
jgi:KAP family P-loop domain